METENLSGGMFTYLLSTAIDNKEEVFIISTKYGTILIIL